MDDRRVTVLRVVAGALVFATAAFHLLWGLPRAIVYLQGLAFLLDRGVLPDPRPFLFVVYALALFAGPYLVTRDVVTLRRGYQLGAAVMLLAIGAWAIWHLTDHFAFLFPGNAVESAAADHTGIVATVVDHYIAKPTEGAVKTVELGASMAFGALLRWDPAVRRDGR